MAVSIKSTGILLPQLSSAPAAPAAGITKLYADNSNNLVIIGNSGGSRIISGDVFVLNDHDDVTITSPAVNQGLKYNGSIWVNSAIPLYPQILDDVPSVVVGTPASGSVVVSFNGTSYVVASNKYAYYEKTGGTTGVTVNTGASALTDRIVYATPDVNRESGGDAVLLDTFYFKPRSDAIVTDYGIYRMDGWFRFAHVTVGSPSSPTATITVKWAEISGLSVVASVDLNIFDITTDDPYFINVSHTFKADASSGKNYVFLVEKSNSQPYTMWHQTSIKKISHSIS